jgi:hypothetical protein
MFAVALAGCKSSAVPKTESGLPEVIVRVQKADDVKGVAREFFRARGYVETASRHVDEVVFDKPTSRGRALRVRLQLYKQGDGTWRLVGAPRGVEGWRSDLESEVSVPRGASQIQTFLIEIKSRAESAR